MPILKGRAGELRAIERLPVNLASRVTPIFEVAPTDRGPIKDAYTFTRRAQRSIPSGMKIGIDVQRLGEPAAGIRRPLRDIAEDLGAWGIPILPVVYLDDSDERLTDVGVAAEVHG